MSSCVSQIQATILRLIQTSGPLWLKRCLTERTLFCHTAMSTLKSRYVHVWPMIPGLPQCRSYNASSNTSPLVYVSHRISWLHAVSHQCENTWDRSDFFPGKTSDYKICCYFEDNMSGYLALFIWSDFYEIRMTFFMN